MNDVDQLDRLPICTRKNISDPDRELLKLAARALNAEFEVVDGEGYGNLRFPDGSTVHAWNPLVHEADAFKLIVKLGLSVSVKWDEEYAIAVTSRELSCDENGSFEDLTVDPGAATCRAVTRAAAEIGKNWQAPYFMFTAAVGVEVFDVAARVMALPIMSAALSRHPIELRF